MEAKTCFNKNLHASGPRPLPSMQVCGRRCCASGTRAKCSRGPVFLVPISPGTPSWRGLIFRPRESAALLARAQDPGLISDVELPAGDRAVFAAACSRTCRNFYRPAEDLIGGYALAAIAERPSGADGLTLMQLQHAHRLGSTFREAAISGRPDRACPFPDRS